MNKCRNCNIEMKGKGQVWDVVQYCDSKGKVLSLRTPTLFQCDKCKKVLIINI